MTVARSVLIIVLAVTVACAGSTTTTTTPKATIPLTDAQLDHLKAARYRLSVVQEHLQTIQSEARASMYEQQNAAVEVKKAEEDVRKEAGVDDRYDIDLDNRQLKLR